MRKIILCLLCLLSLSLSAQTEPRPLTLSANDTVVERMTLPPGERGMEVPLTLKFSYDEATNTVTVIAESTSNIFGLQAGARYNNIFKKGHIFRVGGRFMPERLAYDVNMDPSNKYRMRKPTRKTLGKWKVRKNYYFHRWVESDNMDARTAKTELLGKQLVQVFSLAPGQEKATLSLRDIFTVERKGATPSKWKKLLFTLHQDLNIAYAVQIQHNPCFGKDEELAAAKATVQQLHERFVNLMDEYPATNPLQPAKYKAFMNHRDSLIISYPLQTKNSECPELHDVYEHYNSLVDSVITQHRELTVPAPAASGSVVGNLLGNSRSLDANGLQFKARQLDELVGRWQLATDLNERLNISRQCQKIVTEAAKLANGKTVTTAEQRLAVATFKRALDYYRRTVK